MVVCLSRGAVEQAATRTDSSAVLLPSASPTTTTTKQLLFLVKRFDERGALACEEWAEVVPGNLPLWLMVKNYALQYILLEATHLRSGACITGACVGRRRAGCAGVHASAGALLPPLPPGPQQLICVPVHVRGVSLVPPQA